VPAGARRLRVVHSRRGRGGISHRGAEGTEASSLCHRGAEGTEASSLRRRGAEGTEASSLRRRGAESTEGSPQRHRGNGGFISSPQRRRGAKVPSPAEDGNLGRSVCCHLSGDDAVASGSSISCATSRRRALEGATGTGGRFESLRPWTRGVRFRRGDVVAPPAVSVFPARRIRRRSTVNCTANTWECVGAAQNHQDPRAIPTRVAAAKLIGLAFATQHRAMVEGRELWRRAMNPFATGKMTALRRALA
jgi:hypothetical protein